MKTQEELNRLKNEYEALIIKFQQLTEDELIQVAGGTAAMYKEVRCPKCTHLFSKTKITGKPIFVRSSQEFCPDCNMTVMTVVENVLYEE